MKRLIRKGQLVFLSLIFLFLCGCGDITYKPQVVSDEDIAQSTPEIGIQPQGKVYFSYFDTASYIYSYAGDGAELFDERCKAVSDILSDYHQLFDIYHEYTGINNLCTLNRMAGGEPMNADKRLIDFLLYAKDVYEISDGEMNVMLGPVLKIWHNARTLALDNPEKAAVPNTDELRFANEHTDISLLEIDEQAGTVRISDPLASIDVGALGKGYATEKAAEWLENQGITSYVLNIGGNIRIIGSRPDGTGWSTGIKNPSDPSGSFARKLELQNVSCVTSGIYERFYVANGVSYHHIIDKDTLFPSAYFASVTVVTHDSGLADALSTALFCMSVEDGRELADKLGNVDVLWITVDGEQFATPGMEKLTIIE